MSIFDDFIKEHGLEDNKKVTDLTEGTQITEEVPNDAKANQTEKPEDNKDDKDDKKKEEPKDDDVKTKPVATPVEDNKTEDKNDEKDETKKEGEDGKEDKQGEQTPTKTEDDDNKNKEEDNEKELDELKEKIKELTAKVTELTVANEKLEKMVKSEKTLKESAEAKLIEYRKKEKLSLVESVNKLREQLELPKEDNDLLMENSEESLNATIKSLKEFVEVKKNSTSKLHIIESPVAVSDEKDNTIKKDGLKDVKESANVSNKDFESDLLGIFSKCFR